MFWARTRPVPEAATDLGEIAPPKPARRTSRARSERGPAGASGAVAGVVVGAGGVVGAVAAGRAAARARAAAAAGAIQAQGLTGRWFAAPLRSPVRRHQLGDPLRDRRGREVGVDARDR